jgi:hypothetical protein
MKYQQRFSWQILPPMVPASEYEERFYARLGGAVLFFTISFGQSPQVWSEALPLASAFFLMYSRLGIVKFTTVSGIPAGS